MSNRIIDVSIFEQGDPLFKKSLYLIVKSQDQIERRARMIAILCQGKKIGRMEYRDIASGLLVRCSLSENGVLSRDTSLVFEFQEPRGLAPIGDGRFLLSDVSRVMLIDSDANIIQIYTHPYFAFLHSVSYDSESQHFLVVSSGYDCLIEMDLQGNVCWEWFTWEHGFNPTSEGVYLCRTSAQADEFASQGKEALFVDPLKYKAYGLMTSQRSNHPNSGCYHPSDRNVVLATMGHSGEVIEIDKRTGEWQVVVSGLEMMPHGIQPYNNGWMVTNTLMGEFWILNRNFEIVDKIVTRNLRGKSAEIGENEWLQAVYPVSDGCFLGLDANRGLIFINLQAKQYYIYPVDESWCVHHLVVQS